MVILQDIGAVLVLIGVMIMIHELGHYWAARFFDVKVDAFSFGFGPRLFGFRRGETDFRVSAILFGGYVKMAGEQPGDEAAADPRSFLSKARWQRLIIAFAGPFMNIVLAVVILTGLYMVRYPKLAPSPTPGGVGVVLPNSPAAKAGVQEGDRVIAIDGLTNPGWDEIRRTVVFNPNQPLQLTLLREGKEIQTTLTPEADPREGIGGAGWAEEADIHVKEVERDMDAARKGLKPGDVLVSVDGHPIRSTYRFSEIIRNGQGKPIELLYSRGGRQHKVTIVPSLSTYEGKPTYRIGVRIEPRIIYVQLGFADAITESVRDNIRGADMIYQFLRGIIMQRFSPKSVEGPLRIAQLSGDAARESWADYLGLMAVVSLNLAIFNLLPIPILDGGMIVMLLFEMILRKDLSLQFKEAVLKLGFVFLMIVVMFVLYNDITKIMPSGS